MHQKFESKISVSLVVFISGILGGLLVLFIMKRAWPGLIPLLFAALFVRYIFLNTYYVLKEEVLLVKGGLVDENIKVASIKSIEETHTLISAPALSFDRLEIRYNKHDSVIVSPRNKQAFIDSLLTVNPAIVLRLKHQRTSNKAAKGEMKD